MTVTPLEAFPRPDHQERPAPYMPDLHARMGSFCGRPGVRLSMEGREVFVPDFEALERFSELLIDVLNEWEARL